jgi:hypothetical protein
MGILFLNYKSESELVGFASRTNIYILLYIDIGLRPVEWTHSTTVTRMIPRVGFGDAMLISRNGESRRNFDEDDTTVVLVYRLLEIPT